MTDPAGRRSSRTRLLVSQYAGDAGRFFGIPVSISAEARILGTPNGRVMLGTLVNLVSRFASRLAIALPPGHEKAGVEMANLASATGCRATAGPGVGAAAGGLGGASSRPEISVCVGRRGQGDASAPFSVHIDSSGWVAYVACGRPVGGRSAAVQNPIGAMGAACLGSAEVFKRMLEVAGCRKKEVGRHPHSLAFSFLDYSASCPGEPLPPRVDAEEPAPAGAGEPLPPRVDAGELTLAGAGAVGTSFLYAARESGAIHGSISVVDDDRIDASSLNRCPLFFEADVGRAKSEAAEAASSDRLAVAGHTARIAEHLRQIGGGSAIVSAVDNNEARRDIQFSLPRVVFHGATGGAVAAASVVKLLENACLCCIFDEAPSRESAISGETGIPLEMVQRALKNGGSFTREHLSYVEKKWGLRFAGLGSRVGQKFEDVYAKEVCGAVPADASAGEAASAPFVSFFAGLALASEVIKYYSSALRGFPMAKRRDFVQVSLFSPQSLNLARRIKSPACALGCSRADVQGMFRSKWPDERGSPTTPVVAAPRPKLPRATRNPATRGRVRPHPAVRPTGHA